MVTPTVPDAFAWFWQIGSFLFGLAFFIAVVALAVLLVRFLLVGTKAAKLYIASQQPTVPVAPAAPPVAPTAAAAKSRDAKTPPAAV